MHRRCVAFIALIAMLISTVPVSATGEQRLSVQQYTSFDEMRVGTIGESSNSIWSASEATDAICVYPSTDKIGKHLVLNPTYAESTELFIQQKNPVSFSDFIVEGRFLIKKHNGCVLELVRVNYDDNQWANLLSLDSSGKLIDAASHVICDVKENRYYRFSVLISESSNTYDIYINGKVKDKGIKLPENISADTYWRIQVSEIEDGCTSLFHLDDLAVYSTYNNKPCSPYTFQHIYSVTEYENLTEGFLFVQGVPVMSSGGKLVETTKPQIIDETPYIPVVGLSEFFNDDISVQNVTDKKAEIFYSDRSLEVQSGENGISYGEQILVNAYKLAELLNKHIWCDVRSGIIFFSNRKKSPSWYNDKEAMYMAMMPIIFHRPSADKIRSDFSAHMSKGEHPRIIFDKEGLDKLLANVKTSEVMKGYAEDVIKSAENYAKAEPTKYDIPDGLRLYAACEDARVRICYLAMAYLLCDDAETKVYYAEKVWEETENVCVNWKDWNPYHFLDTGVMASGVAIAYDWLYNYWTPERKAVMEEALYNRGVREILKDLNNVPRERVNNWTGLENNWGFICVGGVGIGALAIADIDKYTDDCGVMLEKGLRHLERCLPNYGPDGGYPEGTSYWGMASEHFARLTDSLIASCGSDYGLLNAPGIKETGYFPLTMMGPCGSFNFGDSTGGVSRAVLFFARHNNDSTLQGIFSEDRSGTIESLLWYSPELEKEYADISDVNYYRILETITMRDSSGKGTFIGFHAGDNDASHAHFDMGSFVLDMNGKRFALDLGPGNYNDSGGFYRYRYSAEGHNTWVINPDSTYTQDVSAFCKIDSFDYDENEAYAISDITEAYKKKIKHIRRGIMAIENYSGVIVQDELDNGSTPFEGYWQMHTTADIDILEGGKQAILTIDDDCVLVSLLTDNDAVFEVMECEPFPNTPKYASSVSDSDKKKIVLHLENATSETVAVEFRHFAKGTAPPSSRSKVKKLADWQLNSD